MNALISGLTKRILVITIFLIIINLSCSDDPSSPEEEKPKDKITIGVGGGSIQKGDFTLTIPPGAFNKNYDISVNEIADDGAFGEDTKSLTYSIAGLPLDILKPLKISIKYSGKLSEDKFIAVGNEFYNEVHDSTSLIYNLYEVIDSSGFIISEIPVYNSNSLLKTTKLKNSLADNSKKFVSIVDFQKTYVTKHFKIRHSITQTKEMVELGNILESVYDIMVNGLKYLEDKHSNIPVVVKNQNKTVDYSIDFSAEDGFEFSFNISRDDISISNLDDFEKIKINFFNTFFDLGINEKYISIPNKQWNKDNFKWMRFAFYTWAEKYISTKSNFTYSANFEKNVLAPFNGVQYSASSENEIYKNHGYGMASLIEYLEKYTNFGQKGFQNTYKNISAEIDPLKSMFNNVDILFIEWFADYYKKLINNEIYELPKDYFINNVTSSWDVNNSSDTLKIFNAQDSNVDTYLDLSAKLFKINLNYKSADETYKMRFSVQGPVDQFGLYFHIFGIQNNELTFIESVAGIYYYEIPNLINSYDEFLVCVVNGLGNTPYIGESDIDLKVQIGNNFGGGGGSGEFDFNYCEYSLFVNRFYEREDGSTFEQEIIIPHSVRGEMIGNRFIAKEEISVFADTLELTLNETGDTINFLNWKSWYRTEFPSSTQITDIEAYNIPIFNSSEKIFKVLGIQTCASIGHYSFYQNFQGNETVMKSFSCNENSYLEIRLSKRE